MPVMCWAPWHGMSRDTKETGASGESRALRDSSCMGKYFSMSSMRYKVLVTGIKQFWFAKRCVTLSPSLKITRLHIALLSSRCTARARTPNYLCQGQVRKIRKHIQTRTCPRILKSQSKRHDLLVCWLVDIVAVLKIQQMRLYLHYWYRSVSLLAL